MLTKIDRADLAQLAGILLLFALAASAGADSQPPFDDLGLPEIVVCATDTGCAGEG